MTGLYGYLLRFIKYTAITLVVLLVASSMSAPTVVPSTEGSAVGLIDQSPLFGAEMVPLLVLAIQSYHSPDMSISNGKLKPAEQVEQELVDNLKGKTLDVYLLLKDQVRLGVREVQRSLEYSSPNLAYYHLNKLYEANLVTKTPDNKYEINQDNLLDLEKTETYHSLTPIFAVIFALFSIISMAFSLLQVPSIIWGVTFTPFLAGMSLYFGRKMKRS